MVLLLVQMAQGQSALLGLAIVVVSVLGLTTRMRMTPVLLVLLLAVSQIGRQLLLGGIRSRYVEQPELTFRISDVLLCLAVLGFVIGHYRLQGLTRNIFPVDYRLFGLRRIRAPGSHWRMPAIERRRAMHLISPVEQALLVLSLPFWALAAQLVWIVASRPLGLLDWDPWVVRLAVLVVLLVPASVVGAALLGYWRRRRMTLDEATLLLQDTLWRETRGEQRWFTRWLAWFRIQENERKEQP